MKKLIALTFIISIAFIFWLITHLGGFKEVELSEKAAGPFELIGRDHLGAYHKIAPVITEVETWIKANGDDCTLTFGQYLDDVESVPEDRLRSFGGCIVSSNYHPTNLPEGYRKLKLESHRYLVAQFEGAPSIGPIKVYPKAMEYLEHHRLTLNGPIMETYELLGQKGIRTRYYFPITDLTGENTAGGETKSGD